MERIKIILLVDIDSGEMDSEEFEGEIMQNVFDAVSISYPKKGAMAKGQSIKLGKLSEEEKQEPAKYPW